MAACCFTGRLWAQHFFTWVGVHPKVLQFTFPSIFGSSLCDRHRRLYFHDDFTLHLFSRHLEFNYVTMSEFTFTTVLESICVDRCRKEDMTPLLLYDTVEGLVWDYVSLLLYSRDLHVFARTNSSPPTSLGTPHGTLDTVHAQCWYFTILTYNCSMDVLLDDLLLLGSSLLLRPSPYSSNVTTTMTTCIELDGYEVSLFAGRLTGDLKEINNTEDGLLPIRRALDP